MPIDTCPICKRDYAQLSQHLRVSHGVKNLDERRLLLALQSGRVSVREGRCPVLGCNKESPRLDRHLKAHSELTVATRRMHISEMKRLLCLQQLAALRASDPEVPMVSTLDLMEEEEGVFALELSEEEGAEEPEESGCSRRACMVARETIAQLNSQVDTLTSTLKELSRRFRILQRRSHRRPSDIRRQTKQLLSSCLIEEDVAEEDEVPPSPSQQEDPEPSPQPSSSQGSCSKSPATSVEHGLPQFPDHVAVLNTLMEQYRAHQEGPDPSTKLRDNVASKVYRIKRFVAYMAQGGGKLQTLDFLNDTERMRRQDQLHALFSTSEDEAEPVYQESGASLVESEENSSDGDQREARSSVAMPMRQAAIVLTPLKLRWSPAESPNKLSKEYPSSA
ncbi:hypothetical protein E1301_Tti022006 [Triplophysa tibetana]|uniref:Uncharacterized protein n=1 Tax=Triplophysa tibetana TaxID=1572043 RepID=A0A5A9NGV4_9TELE|nr:hypothetical protein E1301_Tti022006 [Triplophysa tibetana]